MKNNKKNIFSKWSENKWEKENYWYLDGWINSI